LSEVRFTFVREYGSSAVFAGILGQNAEQPAAIKIPINNCMALYSLAV